MQGWYVIQVFSMQEKKVQKALKERLEQAGLMDLVQELLLPVENVSEVKKGQQKVVERRIWPGYLLAHMTISDELWQCVKNTPGVIGFLGGEKPVALSQQEVQEILRDLEDKKQKVTQKHKFEVGDRVKIVDGVFVNFVGTVLEVFHDKGRLSALVSIFGRETRVDDLDFTQVEETTEKDGE